MTLTDVERMELARRINSRNGRADEARRARCMVLLAAGVSWGSIRTLLRCGDSYIARWSQRFATERLAADVIGLYLNAPQHAAVFCVDEKTAIQALDRLDPVLPLSPGRAERHGFEYYRHGTLSLYAAFNTKTGEVIGKTTERHTSEEFVSFLTDVVAQKPDRKE